MWEPQVNLFVNLFQLSLYQSWHFTNVLSKTINRRIMDVTKIIMNYLIFFLLLIYLSNLSNKWSATRIVREGVKITPNSWRHIHIRGGGVIPCQQPVISFLREKDVECTETKKMYFNETFFEIYSVGPVCFIKFYAN